MNALHTLRKQQRTLVRWMLLWFALSLGVAVASPAVNPQALTLVCSAAGSVQLRPVGDADTPQVMSHTLDCVLCMVAGAPPQTEWLLPTPLALAHVQRSVPGQRPAGRITGAAEARGPPAQA